MTTEELKLQIDTDITGKTQVKSITPTNVGTNLKAIVDYVDVKTPYKSYIALIDQSSTNAPTLTVLENTTGLTFSTQRQGVGAYKLYPNENLPNNKVIVYVPTMEYSSGELSISSVVEINVISIYTRDVITNSPVDSALVGNYGAFLEIRIYP